MDVFELGVYRKARVWWGELPDLHYDPTEVLQRTLQTSNLLVTEKRSAAIEFYKPAHSFSYGLLGAGFTPGRLGQFVIQVAISDYNGQPLEWSLAQQIDNVYTGLPAEYAQSVFEGASEAETVLGSGVLRFDCAAHGLVGSSPVIFRLLSKAIVHLLAAAKKQVAETELRELLGYKSE
jgi:hypothetical protein